MTGTLSGWDGQGIHHPPGRDVVFLDDAMHERALEAAEAANLPFLLRMADSYADAEFLHSELPDLVVELEFTRRNTKHNDVVQFADGLRELALWSRDHGLGVYLASD